MNAREQHLATRRAAGLFDFSFMGLYEFSGADALARAQTRDLSKLAQGRIAYSLILDGDGSVFNDATVWHLGGGRWWLFTGRPTDFARFRDHARDRSGEYAILALQGPLSGRILARLAGEEIVRRLEYFSFVEAGGIVIGRIGYSGELGYELLVPRADEPKLRGALLDAGRADKIAECSFEAANTLRIESGYVLFDREIDGRANARELGLERLAPSRGPFELRRKLVGLEIVEAKGIDRPKASVTSECSSPTLEKPIALGFADADASAGENVRLADGRAARVTPLPFYDPVRKRPRAAPLG